MAHTPLNKHQGALLCNISMSSLCTTLETNCPQNLGNRCNLRLHPNAQCEIMYIYSKFGPKFENMGWFTPRQRIPFMCWFLGSFTIARDRLNSMAPHFVGCDHGKWWPSSNTKYKERCHSGVMHGLCVSPRETTRGLCSNIHQHEVSHDELNSLNVWLRDFEASWSQGRNSARPTSKRWSKNMLLGSRKTLSTFVGVWPRGIPSGLLIA